MATERFDLAESGGWRHWLERDGDKLVLCRGQSHDSSREELGLLDRDRVRDLVLWAAGESVVTGLFDGPMANEIKKASAELGIPEQMVVWNAVKLFLEVGASGA